MEKKKKKKIVKFKEMQKKTKWKLEKVLHNQKIVNCIIIY